MTYYELQSEAEALAVAATIVSNVAGWVSVNMPDRFDPVGPALRGLRASDSTVVFKGGQTRSWAVPQITAAGTWVIPVPTAAKVAPMPLAAVTAGISASTVDDPQWPAPPEESP